MYHDDYTQKHQYTPFRVTHAFTYIRSVQIDGLQLVIVKVCVCLAFYAKNLSACHPIKMSTVRIPHTLGNVMI